MYNGGIVDDTNIALPISKLSSIALFRMAYLALFVYLRRKRLDAIALRWRARYRFILS